MNPKVEHHNAYGRSDLEVHARCYYWALGLKLEKYDKSGSQKLLEAIEQIKQKAYGLGGMCENKVRIALVFSLVKRQFIRWKKVA